MEEKREKNRNSIKKVLFIEDAVDDGAARFVEHFHRENNNDYKLDIAPTIMEAVRIIEHKRYDMIIFDNHVAIGKEPDAELEPELHRFYIRYQRLARKKKEEQERLRREVEIYRPDINVNSLVFQSMVSRLSQHAEAPILGYEFLFTLYGAVKKTYAMIPLKKYPDWIKSLFKHKQVGIFTIDIDAIVEGFLDACNLPKDNHYQWKANAEDSALLSLIERIARAKTK